MIYFVEDLPTEWQQKWDDMRQKSGRDYTLRKLNFKALLAFQSRLEESDWRTH